MPYRYVLNMGSAFASNTGGPYTHPWDRVVVPATGTIRGASAVAAGLSSNARTNSVDIYKQTDAPAAGSNTATSILVDPITLVNDNDAANGTISHAGMRVSRGDQLQLRTYADTVHSTPAFTGLAASVEIERDPD